MSVSKPVTTPAADRAGWVLLVVAVLILWSPLYQHPNWEANLANGTLPLALRAEPGSPEWLRYARDAVALAGVAVGFAVRPASRSAFIAFMAGQGILIACGLIGHLFLPRPQLLVAGMRWIVNVQLFASYLLVLPQCSERWWAWLSRVFNWSCGLLILITLVGFTIQWIAVDYATIYRLNSVFSDVGSIIAFSIGGMIYVNMTDQPASLRWSVLSFGLASAFFTATRGIVFVVIILAMVSPAARAARRWRARFPRLAEPLWAIVGLPLAILLVITTPFATFLGHRGDLLEQQSDDRIGIFLKAPFVLSTQESHTLILGKGLGYQTTTANTLGLMDIYHDEWISGPDSGLFSVYAQVGFLGATLFLLCGIYLLTSTYRASSGDEERQVAATALMVIYPLLLLTSWFYEWHVLMVATAISISYCFRKQSRSRRASTFPSRSDV